MSILKNSKDFVVNSFHNFKERILFDLVHRTTSSQRLEIEQFISTTPLDHGKAYYASWTSEIKNNHAFLMNYIKDDFKNYHFLDLGCGKGKVCLLWNILNQKKGIQQNITGIDFYYPLIQIAKSNYRKLFSDEGHFIHGNVADFNFLALKKPLIIYLFNPFDEYMLDCVLNKIGKIPTYVVYNIPMHWNVLSNHAYQRIYAKSGSNQNQTTLIYTNIKSS
jgi:SAM-dependent methyltransferase